MGRAYDVLAARGVREGVRRTRRLDGMDVTDATFERDVLEASRERPVVVDLWAPWCAPCHMLSPIIEKVVAETEGRVLLAKVNVDENPGIAQAFRVQGIPAVFAIRDGKVVDSFVGAYPEPAVRDFVNKLAPAETVVDVLIAEGTEPSLRQALELEPGNERAAVGLVELLLVRGELEEAASILERFPETEQIAALKARVRLAQRGEAALSEDDVVARLEELLGRVKGDEAARQEFVDLLRLLPEGDPRVAAYRRRLASALF